MKNMALFLRYLTDQMHERVPGSVVIWYDSVLKDGSLKWQNELNDGNRQVRKMMLTWESGIKMVTVITEVRKKLCIV